MASNSEHQTTRRFNPVSKTSDNTIYPLTVCFKYEPAFPCHEMENMPVLDICHSFSDDSDSDINEDTVSIILILDFYKVSYSIQCERRGRL